MSVVPAISNNVNKNHHPDAPWKNTKYPVAVTSSILYNNTKNTIRTSLMLIVEALFYKYTFDTFQTFYYC